MKSWINAVIAMVIIIIAVISLIEWNKPKPPYLERCRIWGSWMISCDVQDK